MDLTSLFISTIIVMFLSFVVEMLIGFDFRKILATLTIIPFAVPVLFFVITALHDVEATTSFLTWYINMFADALPGMIVGEIIGTIAAALTRIFRSARIDF